MHRSRSASSAGSPNIHWTKASRKRGPGSPRPNGHVSRRETAACRRQTYAGSSRKPRPGEPAVEGKAHSWHTHPVRTGPVTDVPVAVVSGTGVDLRLSRDPWVGGEAGGYENSIWSFTSASCGTLGAVAVACVRCDVGAVVVAPGGSAASLSLPGPRSLRPARVSGRDPVRALHRHALVAGALPRAWLAER